MKHAVLLVLLGLGAAGCTPPPPTPTLADVSRVGSRYPGLTLAELSDGRELYQSRCGSCHNLYSPARYAPKDWARLLGEMAARAKLTAPEQNLVEHYLVAVSSRTRELAGREQEAAYSRSPQYLPSKRPSALSF